MSRIYKYKGRDRIKVRGKDIAPKSEVILQAYDSVDLDSKFKLVGSSNDLRSRKLKPPIKEIDWTLPTMELKESVNKLDNALYSYLKNKLYNMGCALNLSDEMPTYKAYTIEHILDFAFDCGWTKELDELDAENEPFVQKIARKIKTHSSNDKSRNQKKDSGKQSKRGREKETLSRTRQDSIS